MAAKTPQDNIQNIADLQSQQSILFDITEELRKQNKEAKVSNLYTQQQISETTKLKNIIQSTQDLLGRINVDIIKRSSYVKIIAKLEAQIKKLQAEALNIQKNASKYDQAQSNLLKQQQERLKKVNDEEAVHDARKIKADTIVNDLQSRLYELQKKNKTQSASYISGMQRLQKLLAINQELDKKSVEYTKQKKEIQDNIAKISQSDFIKASKLNESQINVAKRVLEIAKSQSSVIDESNTKLRRNNFFYELFRRLPGLSIFADLPKQVEIFGAGLTIALSVISLIVITIKEIFETILKVDKQITSIAKNLGISKDAAKVLRQHFADLSEFSDKSKENINSLFVTATNLIGAMDELNSAFGIAVTYSDQQLKDQISITKVMGLEVETATNLQKLAILNAESAHQTNLDILQQVVNLNKQNKIRVDARKILEQVSKIEGQLAIQYKNNPKLLAAAVLQAKQFGISLEQAKKSADSLLDFETSIDSQLEAQLLTDKALNFERARELALLGDSAGAAADLLRQVGSLNQFQRLNVIQQSSIAKAVGMTADELSNALRYQQLLNNLGKEQKANLDNVLSKYKGTSQYASKLKELQAATNAEELEHNLNQISIQQQFEQSMAKVKDILASLITPAFIDSIQSLANWFTNNLPAIMSTLKFFYNVATFFARGTMEIANIFDAGLTLPKYVHDGLISPKGDVVISTPKGSIIPDKNDSIITTTNPNKLLGGNNIDISILAVKLDKLIALMEKGGNVYMDSKKIGTTMALAYNSYK